jgi:hypothetical protein
MVAPLIVGQSPGVYTREEDYSGETVGTNVSIGAMVFGSKKGSLSPRRKTSFSSFTADYGISDTAWSYAHIMAEHFFDEGNQLQCLRVVGPGAKYANAAISYILPSTIGGAVSNATSMGTTGGYETGGGVQVQVTQLSTPLIAGSAISGTLTANGITVNISSTPFNTDTIGTMTAVATATQAAMNNLQNQLNAATPAQSNYTKGYIKLINGGFGAMLISSPENVSVTAKFTVTGQTANLVVGESNLVDIFAENPGDWANDIGYNITNIDAGILQRVRLTFGGPVVAGNILTINLLVNKQPVTIGPFTSTVGMSNDAFMGNLGQLLLNALSGGQNVGNVSINYPGGFGANSARIIDITSTVPGDKYIEFVGYSFAGAGAPILYFDEIKSGLASTGAFTLNVFTRSNVKYPKASFRVALKRTTDGLQNQLYMEEVINKASGRSSDIRVVVNTSMVLSGYIIDPKFATQFAQVRFLNGGANGTLPLNGAISQGWDVFRNTELYPMSILINAGYTDQGVQQKISAVAEERKDCIAILDVPSDYQDVDSIYNWRTQVSNINTSYTTLNSPDILVLDTNTSERIYVPPSGSIASRYVYTDNNFATWFAPAGYDRGRLPRALDFRYTYSKPERDIIDGVQINCGKHASDGSGLLIFGENTSQVTPTLLSSIGVRRMLIFVENSMAKSLERNLFDINSAQLGFIIRKRLERFLQPIKDDYGIKNFLVKVDATNNPASFADAGQLNVTVYIVPNRPVKIILLDTIITPSSITFNEFIVNGGV